MRSLGVPPLDFVAKQWRPSLCDEDAVDLEVPRAAGCHIKTSCVLVLGRDTVRWDTRIKYKILFKFMVIV